jgi:hypothetical protein
MEEWKDRILECWFPDHRAYGSERIMEFWNNGENVELEEWNSGMMEEWEEEDRMQEAEDRISRKQQYRSQNTPVEYAKAFHPDGIAQQKHSIGQAGQAGESRRRPPWADCVGPRSRRDPASKLLAQNSHKEVEVLNPCPTILPRA